jgi:hypothetical protein
MEWWQHAIMGLVYATPFLLFISWWAPLMMSPLDIVALFTFDLPDQDARKVRTKDVTFVQGGTKHRHWFWHSAIIPIVVFVVAARLGVFNGVGTFCAVIAAHLLSDIKVRGKKMGTYCIYLRKGARMSARGSDRYLFANGLICITLGALSLFL